MNHPLSLMPQQFIQAGMHCIHIGGPHEAPSDAGLIGHDQTQNSHAAKHSQGVSHCWQKFYFPRIPGIGVILDQRVISVKKNGLERGLMVL
jgi:hypothetical protein